MSDKPKHTFKWLEKLKKVKHIEIYVAVIFIAVLGLIYMSNYKSKDEPSAQTNELTTVTAYVDNLENNLEEIISNIGGVSNVKVMITLDMNEAQVENSQINLSHFPPIKGVIVTAKGVNDTSLKLKVLHAIQAVIDITNGNIEILSSG